MKKIITSSIVLFNNDITMLRIAIDSLLKTNKINRLFLIDNSLNDSLRILDNDKRIEYIHNPANPGFGAAHNIAIQKSLDFNSEFHFIVNPDISFDNDVISPMVEYLEKNSTIGMMMPQILNSDGTIQYLPKLLPSPFSLLMRKIKRPKAFYRKFLNKYELRNVPKNFIYNVPIISGCFTLLNLKAIEGIGMYDDAYFMYFEDWDLSRRMQENYETIYFPEVSVYHGYDSGANKSYKMFKIFVSSAITYFNKWGWFFDKKRREINKKTLSQFEKIS